MTTAKDLLDELEELERGTPRWVPHDTVTHMTFITSVLDGAHQFDVYVSLESPNPLYVLNWMLIHADHNLRWNGRKLSSANRIHVERLINMQLNRDDSR